MPWESQLLFNTQFRDPVAPAHHACIPGHGPSPAELQSQPQKHIFRYSNRYLHFRLATGVTRVHTKYKS